MTQKKKRPRCLNNKAKRKPNLRAALATAKPKDVAGLQEWLKKHYGRELKL